MNINNIALVRATNVLPLDGIVKPISNVSYLCKEIDSHFSSMISDILHEAGIIPPIDYTRMNEDGYYDEMVHLSSQILEEYLPYSSDYNSMVLFSLNGICPDDNEHSFANNIFSDKDCGIIDSLSSHIDQVISLMPTDTALLGNVSLSKDAIVLIRENVFQTLSEQDKVMLQHLPFSVKTFKGNLRDAIYQELQNSGRYIPERLSLSRKDGGFYPSSTSEEQKKVIRNIASMYGKAQVLFFNILDHRNDEMEKLDCVKNEFSFSLLVRDYYMERFLEEFLFYFQAPEKLRSQVFSSLSHSFFYEKIEDFVKQVGIGPYKKFLDYYNDTLLQEQNNGTLLTPQEIVQRQKNLGAKTF